MRKFYLIIITIIVVISVSIYFIFFRTHSISLSELSVSSSKPLSSSDPLDKEYSNSTYQFSLKMPTNLEAHETEVNDTYTIVLQNKKGEGIQILISPFDDIHELTAEMIHKDLPKLKISNPQILEIKDGYRGLFFQSDNQAFDGASQEVWFVFQGNLYQISTYKKFGDILKNILSTWKFTK